MVTPLNTAVALEAAVDVTTIDPIVPIEIHGGATLDDYARDLRDAKRRFGLKRFTIIANSAGPQIARLREKIADPEIQLGWWCCPTLRQGPNHPYTFVTDDDGTPSNALVCPYDPEFRKMFLANIEENARAGHPFIVFFEDDYMTAYQVGMNNEIGGCFCPRHMEAFHKATGTKFTAKEVANNMSGDVRDDLRFEFSKRWTGKKVSRLGMDGNWIPLGTTASAWKPGLKFEICQPEFFLVSDAVK